LAQRDSAAITHPMLADGKFIALWLALAGGMMLPVQMGVNATLRRFLEHPLQATAISFSVGAFAALLASLALRAPTPSLQKVAESSVWMWIGGALGAFYVFTTIYAGPRIGASVAAPLAIAGQVIIALALDHFGWLGFPQSSLSLLKLFGASLVIMGVVILSYAR
jgi:bacterial/archaeal transporter family-2 protein